MDQIETGTDSTAAERTAEVDPHRSGPVWIISLAAGGAAGLVAALLIELAHAVFKPQLFEIRVALQTFIQPTAASLNAAEFKNATLVFAILGAIAGLAMGIAGGFAGRSVSRGVTAGIAGLAAGGLVGALASLCLLPFFYRRFVPDPNDLLTPMLIHAGIWMAIGAASGASFAVGMRCGRRSFNVIAGAALGALLATLLFHGLGEFFFADSGSTAPVATSASARFLAVFLITILIACGAARGALSHVSRRTAGAKAEISF